MRRWLAVALLALLLGGQGGLAQGPSNYVCRFDPKSTHSGCGLPYKLANFQGYHSCAANVKVGRPSTLEELVNIVRSYRRVHGVGVGHSWNPQQFCAGRDANSVDIVMTELKPTLDNILNPVNPEQWKSRPIPNDFPIQVDEDDSSVWVAAGVPQRILLDYLSEYRHWKQPQGWTLPAYTWFVDQTIGGAVATASHGSSLKHGSLSSQVLALRVVLANGTLLEVSPKSNYHLFKALGTSIGRLGIVTEMKMRIKPQQAIRRTLEEPSFADFVRSMKQIQDAYNGAKAANDTEGMKRALFPIDEVQAFWFLPLSQVTKNSFDHLDKEPLAVELNLQLDDPSRVSAMSGPAEEDVFTQVQKSAIGPNNRMTLNTRYWASFYYTAAQSYVRPGTFESRRAYLSMTEASTRQTSTFDPYEQFEVAVPIEKFADCLAEVGNEVYGPKQLFNGFRSPALIRFTSGEPFYLAPTHGGPHMYVNIEDHISRSSGRPNNEFNTVMKLFRERCGARLHWGKAGWPEFAGCFDGTAEFPESWCDFGCAVRELDPEGKFASEAKLWQWRAGDRGSGQEVEFASACTPAGFDRQRFACLPRKDCS